MSESSRDDALIQYPNSLEDSCLSPLHCCWLESHGWYYRQARLLCSPQKVISKSIVFGLLYTFVLERLRQWKEYQSIAFLFPASGKAALFIFAVTFSLMHLILYKVLSADKFLRIISEHIICLDTSNFTLTFLVLPSFFFSFLSSFQQFFLCSDFFGSILVKFFC